MRLLNRSTMLGLGLVLLAVAVLFLVLGLVAAGSSLVAETTPFDSERSPDEPSPTRDLVVEKEWPKEIDISSSQPVRLSLILDESGDSIGPRPTPGETSHYPLPGEFVLTSAEATLEGAGFEVRDVADREQSPQGRDRIDWEWSLAPRQQGPQTLSLRVDLEIVPADGGSPSYEGWTDRIEVKVLGPGKPFVDIGDFPIVSLITGVLGSALSVPFLHALWKERKTTTGRSKGRR